MKWISFADINICVEYSVAQHTNICTAKHFSLSFISNLASLSLLCHFGLTLIARLFHQSPFIPSLDLQFHIGLRHIIFIYFPSPHRYDIVNINLRSKPEWFFAKNPLGKVPALETENGDVIYESQVTCDYLDQVFPEPKLNPADPLKMARDRMLLELFGVKVRYKWTQFMVQPRWRMFVFLLLLVQGHYS